MYEVVLITGAAGTGKTTTANTWAATRRETSAHLSHDTLLGNVKAGLASPAHHTSAEAERQWRIALDICVAAARIYAGSGIRSAIDTFCLPVHLAFWHELAHLRVGLIALHPPVEVAVARNAARLASSGWGVAEWQVRANHHAMCAWQAVPQVLVLNNAALDMGDVLGAIDAWEQAGHYIRV
jgi:predicted ABC-type ATPase